MTAREQHLIDLLRSCEARLRRIEAGCATASEVKKEAARIADFVNANLQPEQRGKGGEPG